MKNALGGINSILDKAENQISDLENKVEKNTQSERQKKRKKERKKRNLKKV